MLGPALKAHPHRDHHFTLQHCQLADRAQFRRMRTLGVCVNLFANHHLYWGDAHYALTVGPDRALRMNACRTALDQCVPMAIHCGAPVTPLGPLFTAWCAVNRRTASGRVQGAAEKITVAEALYAITLGAAYTLQLDHEVGSIEVGNHADFAVLDADPAGVEDADLKDINVWGTVQGADFSSLCAVTKAVIRVPAKVPAAVPVTVIGGYLGAGKTTLINHLLRTANGVRLAVLVNEFGALSIDEDLMEAEDGNIISIPGGCICCSFGDDLSAALMDICAFKPPPDHILIEASGVAIPAVIDNSLTVLAGGAAQTVRRCDGSRGNCVRQSRA